MKTRKIFAVLLLLLVAFSANVMMAQQMPAIPVDEAVRVGKLDNGLTYYIRHNNYPEHRVNFYIAQRVGSMQEEDHQRGLAHFLEHMAFNGSENFKGNGIIDFTRSLGVEFGSDLNAATGMLTTVYHVNNVPSTRQSALDSCLLILKDWSHGLLLEDEEIDKERGVIHQEWRMRNTGQLRLLENTITQGFPGSKFANRMPIGLMEIVDNFPYQALRDYYHTWYRPDNQAIVIVGDIDVDYTEAKIRELFKDIPAPAADAPQVVHYPVPDNEEGLYITFADKELTQNEINVYFKYDPIEPEMKGNMSYLVINYLKSMMCSMFNARFNEMRQEADCPFTGAHCSNGEYIVADTKDAFGISILPKDGMAEKALQTVLAEVKRVKLYGFTASEYDRARQNFLSTIETMYNKRDEAPNLYYGQVCCDNFLKNEPLLAIDTYYQIMSTMVPQFSSDIVNQSIQQMLIEFVQDSEKNMVVVSNEVEKEGAVHPTAQSLKDAVAAARNAEIEEYVDNVINEPLISNLPKAGKIVKEKVNKTFGYKELELSNGARVILMKTDYKQDEVRMNAFQRGGKSLYSEKDRENLYWLDVKINTITGVGNFGYNDLNKALSGKRAWAQFDMDDYIDYVNGSSNIKDMETLFQLVYLRFTGMSKDEKSFKQQMLNNDAMFLKNKSSNPEAVFDDTVEYVLGNRNWRSKPFTSEDLKKVNYDRIMEIAKERTANAAGYTFTFVGSFDEAAIRPLIEQYIASLPAKKGVKTNWADIAEIPTGENITHFTQKMETPQGMIRVYWLDNKIPCTLENEIKVSILGQLLSRVYLQKIREDAGAAYAAGAAGWMDLKGNRPITYLLAVCPVKPEFKDEALKIFNDEMNNACTTIDADGLKEAQELMLKQIATVKKENTYWEQVIKYYQLYGYDICHGYEDIVKAQTPETISAFARQLLQGNNKVEIVMTPQD